MENHFYQESLASSSIYIAKVYVKMTNYITIKRDS